MEGMIDNVKYEMPDQLADAYTELTADLAFAQTHYPRSRITIYLNNLASALHNEIYRNKREKWGRLITFWTCLLYTSPSPRDPKTSRMPSSA